MERRRSGSEDPWLFASPGRRIAIGLSDPWPDRGMRKPYPDPALERDALNLGRRLAGGEVYWPGVYRVQLDYGRRVQHH